MAMAEIVPWSHEILIVGDGRIGRAFAQMMMGTPCIARLRGKGDDAIILGNDEMAKASSSPILVATHCSHLDSVLERTHESRWKDLVFLQNGMIQPWLLEHGLERNTQALLYMSSQPENPLCPKGTMTVTNGGRDTIVWGRWANVVVEIMQNGGLRCCSASSHPKFLQSMFEKLLWSSIFWLLSEALGSVPVGTIAQKHTHHVRDLTGELLPLAMIEESYNNQLLSEMVDRLCAYSNAIPDVIPSKTVAFSEFKLRNGWFLAQKATPSHVKWLESIGVNDDLLKSYGIFDTKIC